MKKGKIVQDSIISEYEEYLDKLSDEERLYIKNRLLPQIIWYDHAAVAKQSYYKRWSIVSIILTAMIPCLSMLTNYKYGAVISFFIALLGASSSAITAIVNLCEFHKLWIEYRTNCETLKSILHKYLTKTGEYADSSQNSVFNNFISSTEEYLSKEMHSWIQISHIEENQTK